MLFKAGSDEHSSSVDLTYGILEEAWEVLVDFVEGRPHPMRVRILEGMDGKGIPLGEMMISYNERNRVIPGFEVN